MQTPTGNSAAIDGKRQCMQIGANVMDGLEKPRKNERKKA